VSGDAGPDEKSPSIELESSGVTWVHLDGPSYEEAGALAARFGWHPLDVEDVMSSRKRPSIDNYHEDYLFIILHFPVYDPSIGRLAAGELDVFLGSDYLVTLPSVRLLPVTGLFRRCQEDEQFREGFFQRGAARLLFELLDDLFDYCFPIVDKLGYKLDAIENDMFSGLSQEVVRDISNVKQEIISYRTIIKPERETLRLLGRHVEPFRPEEIELPFDGIVDAAERICDLLDNYKEVVEALEDTNESLIGHRLNEVLRVLTLFTAVLLPLTLIASLAALEFRSNLFTPVGGGYFIVVVMGVVVVSMVAYFKRKGWL
jgi:magnesium transporter